MLRGNQRSVIFNRIKEVILRRPLLLPAILLVIGINLFVCMVSLPEVSGNIRCTGIIRHIDMNLDGTIEVIIKTDEYGRFLYKPEQREDLRLGDEVLLQGTAKVYGPPGNPGEFDYGAYLRRRGITGVLYADSISTVKAGSLLQSFAYDIQCLFFKLRNKFLSCFDAEDKAIAAALFTGDTSLIPDEVSREFRLSDCSHLLAVSGTHFSGFLMIITEIIRRFHLKKRVSVPVYVAFCLLTGTLTGWSESVTRASVMSMCSFLSRDYASGMSLAVIMLAVKDPYSLLSNGFLMSFAASLSIRIFGTRISGMLSKTGMPEPLINVLTPVAAATIGMMPFWERTCCYFSFIHLITQITASLLATVACVFFIPCVITGLPFACSLIFKVLLYLVRFTSSFALSGAKSSDLTTGFIYALWGLLVVYLLPECIIRKHLMKPCAVLLTVEFGLMLGSLITAPDVRIVFIDVGQGDSCLIMSRGRSMLIDGGVEDAGRYSVASVMDYYGIDSVDLAVATHMDEDHIGGLLYLDSIGRINKLTDCYGIRAGDVITVTDDLNFYCLWPYEVTDGGNEDSVVLRLEYGDLSVLYTGDIGFESEEELIRAGALIDSDILKVGHHGSAYSTSYEFLESVSPDTAVISVAEHNRYGHPAPSTLERLISYGCEIRRTDQEGAVIFEV